MSETLRVLVIDDNLDLADGLSWILEAEGFAVETAYSAEQGLRKADESSFDVVVLDFKLPGLTGFAARHAIGARLPSARYITMSGWSVDQLLAQTLGAESFRLLRHPFTAARLASGLSAIGGGGLLLAAGNGEESALCLTAQLDELGVDGVVATDGNTARSALDGSAPVLIFDFDRPIVEALDVFFELRESRADELGARRVVLHARPIAPHGAGDDVLASWASTGLFVKPMFDFDDVLRAVRGG